MPQHSNYRGPRKRREKVYEKIFEEIIVENFPNIEKEIGKVPEKKIQNNNSKDDQKPLK